MAHIIETNEDLLPRIVCGKCKEEILIDITPFKKDCTKILQDKCPKCHSPLYVGLMIFTNTSLPGIASVIQTVLSALNKASMIVGGKRTDGKRM